MLDLESQAAILADFDGTAKVGATTSKNGSLGWHPNCSQTAFDNDYYSLVLIGRWLRGEYDPEQRPLPDPKGDAPLRCALEENSFDIDSRASPLSSGYQELTFLLLSSER